MIETNKSNFVISLELHKEEFNFSAGHFTIFSATSREWLHGHNYQVAVELELSKLENGMAFDYRIYKNTLRALCEQVDRRFLLPAYSKYLTILDRGETWIAIFNQQELYFPKTDAVILPITNTTIEELAQWFLDQLVITATGIEHYPITAITLKIFNGPGQSGNVRWRKSEMR